MGYEGHTELGLRFEQVVECRYGKNTGRRPIAALRLSKAAELGRSKASGIRCCMLRDRKELTMYRRTLFATVLLVLCCGLFQIAQATSAHAQTAQQIAKKAFGSTVLFVMEDAKGQPVSLGSGFFVLGGQIASNLHVVEG